MFYDNIWVKRIFRLSISFLCAVFIILLPILVCVSANESYKRLSINEDELPTAMAEVWKVEENEYTYSVYVFYTYEGKTFDCVFWDTVSSKDDIPQKPFLVQLDPYTYKLWKGFSDRTMMIYVSYFLYIFVVLYQLLRARQKAKIKALKKEKKLLGAIKLSEEDVYANVKNENKYIIIRCIWYLIRLYIYCGFLMFGIKYYSPEYPRYTDALFIIPLIIAVFVVLMSYKQQKNLTFEAVTVKDTTNRIKLWSVKTPHYASFNPTYTLIDDQPMDENKNYYALFNKRLVERIFPENLIER